MTASSLMGSCASLVVICSVGEVTGSSCICGLCGQRNKGDCPIGGVVRWNRGGKQRTTIGDVTALLLSRRVWVVVTMSCGPLREGDPRRCRCRVRSCGDRRRGVL